MRRIDGLALDDHAGVAAKAGPVVGVGFQFFHHGRSWLRWSEVGWLLWDRLARLAASHQGRAAWKRKVLPINASIIVERICQIDGSIYRAAPLAQSAEHSHGKAGVVGSIPTGGSLAA